MTQTRRALTEAMVLSLFTPPRQGVRKRSDLEGVRLFGVSEKTAADMADGLAARGLLAKFGGADEVPACFAITAAGRAAYADRPRPDALRMAPAEAATARECAV